MRTLYTSLIIAVLAFLLGIAAFWGFTHNSQTIIEQNATVLLEQVRKVTKLVTVEGDVSEVFNSTNNREVTLYLPLPARFSFRKEAMVQVQGTVLVGYNLEEMALDVDEATRTLRLSNLPEPEILAIDQDLTFKNLEESWFNTFTAEDYSAMSREAKRAMEEKVMSSGLMDAARLEGNNLIETINIIAKGMGYTVELEGVAFDLTPEE